MNAARTIPRSLRPSSSSSSSNTHHHHLLLTHTTTRNTSSFRRSQKMLRVPPSDDHYTNTTANADHIVYNPPSSAPNVYHTPLKFLPPNDPRRRLHSLSASLSTSSSSSSSFSSSSSLSAIAASRSSSASASASAAKLPPSLRPIKEKKYHLTEREIAEIRSLRAADPRTWTRVRLAEKFGCSQFFVSLCAQAPEIANERASQLEAIKKRWGRTKTEAREDRKRRKELWGRE